ncbi:hypothetical protein COB52_02045 [Candidatus Kaiserbacteria bacterium]|nr:MAG: hypothetical protein COB52_02045 [Candidatus Kaiserbacteria bacterium]
MKNRGISLIETLVLIAVFTLIIMAIVSSLRFVYRGQRFAFEQADATRSARQGTERVVKDLRETSYADDGAYPIAAMATSSVTFFSDYDNDGKVERLRYFLDGTDFKEGITESAGDPPAYSVSETVNVVSDNVRNEALSIPLFTFYDKSGTLMSDYTEVDELAFVTVRLVVNLHPERKPEDFEIRSSAALRNIE